MSTFAQSQHCYHTYLIVAMFLALSSTGQTHISIKAKTCRSCPSYTASRQCTSTSVHRTQLPHWSSNTSSLSWHRGLYHSNFGTLGKPSLPPLHQVEPLSSGKFVYYHGPLFYLNITSMSGYLIVCTNYYHVTLILNQVTLILTNLQPNCYLYCLSWCTAISGYMKRTTWVLPLACSCRVNTGTEVRCASLHGLSPHRIELLCLDHGGQILHKDHARTLSSPDLLYLLIPIRFTYDTAFVHPLLHTEEISKTL